MKNQTFTKNDVEIIKKTPLYQGFFRLNHYLLQHRLFAGGLSKTLSRELFEKEGAAAALLYDPILDKVVLLEQFRIGALNDAESPWLIEVVAGILNSQETPSDLIVRETEEEAGLSVLDLHFMYQYWVSPGASTEYLTLFCAKVDASKASGIHGLADEGEDIRTLVLSPQEAYQALEKGKIKNAPTIIGLLWLQLNRELLRSKWLS